MLRTRPKEAKTPPRPKDGPKEHWGGVARGREPLARHLSQQNVLFLTCCRMF